MEEVRRNLNSVVPLGDEAWSEAEAFFLPRHFEAGQSLFRAGEVVTSLVFLTSGLVRFYYCDSKGREFNKSFAGAGQVLSSMSSLAAGEPSPFSVEALLPTAALSMRYTEFEVLAAHHPEWAALRVKLLERLIVKRERREADLLLLSATERYRKFVEEHPGLSGSIPNYHIASYLGITEVALSRIRRRLGLTRVNAPRVD